MIRNIWVIIILHSFPLITFADLPLILEDIIIDQGKMKLNFSISYFNNEQQRYEIGDLVAFQMNDKSIINLPTTINNVKINTDIIISTLGFKYGIYPRMDVYARVNYLNKNSRSTNISVNGEKRHENRLIDSSIGLEYQLLRDTNTPALLGYIETSIF